MKLYIIAILFLVSCTTQNRESPFGGCPWAPPLPNKACIRYDLTDGIKPGGCDGSVTLEKDKIGRPIIEYNKEGKELINWYNLCAKAQ